MDLQEYLDRARSRLGISSDAKLARALSIDPTAVSAYRRNIAFPLPETMLLLAQLAEVNPAEAMLDVAAWRCSRGETRKIYEGIKKQLFSPPA